MSYVLLLEPNTVLAATYALALRHAGYEVHYATSGQHAINLADQRSPGMVIVELQLPRHNGIEFLHEFRSYPEWQAVPVIVNTVITPHKLAAAETPLRQELGVRAILYKPATSLQDLLRIVREHAAAA